MSMVNFVVSNAGKYLEQNSLPITNEQLRIEQPKKIQLCLWKKDKPTETTYELHLIMPWGNVYTLAEYKTEKLARHEYDLLKKTLENGEAKIQIGSTFSIVYG
jgi:hypothetical protein